MTVQVSRAGEARTSETNPLYLAGRVIEVAAAAKLQSSLVTLWLDIGAIEYDRRRMAERDRSRSRVSGAQTKGGHLAAEAAGCPNQTSRATEPGRVACRADARPRRRPGRGGRPTRRGCCGAPADCDSPRASHG